MEVDPPEPSSMSAALKEASWGGGYFNDLKPNERGWRGQPRGQFRGAGRGSNRGQSDPGQSFFKRRPDGDFAWYIICIEEFAF